MSAAARKLLIADDEPWVIENLRGLVDWESLGVELLSPAEDGEDALGKLEAERPDILITDINMPFMNGNELIRIAKERRPGLQAIGLSGYSDFGFVRDALLHGAVDYLLKPVTKNALVDVLDKALAALASGREREREEADLRERLSEASAILRDGEMSALISEEATEAPSASAALDMDLEFASFTLVLAKLTMPAALRGQGAPDMSRLTRDIKGILAKAGGGAACVAFRNVSPAMSSCSSPTSTRRASPGPCPTCPPASSGAPSSSRASRRAVPITPSTASAPPTRRRAPPSWPGPSGARALPSPARRRARPPRCGA